MPKFEGKIAVGRKLVSDDFDKEKMRMPKKEIKRAHPLNEKNKDDFDLPFKEGDDFDI